MSVQTVHVTRDGALVIPREITRKLNVHNEDDFIVIGNRESIFLERITKPANSLGKFYQEKEAFFKLKDELLKDYKGRFVAIAGGKVVDSDEDKKSLAKRIYEKYEDIPFYLQKVQDEELPTLDIPSPEIGEI